MDTEIPGFRLICGCFRENPTENPENLFPEICNEAAAAGVGCQCQGSREKRNCDRYPPTSKLEFKFGATGSTLNGSLP